MVVDDDDDVSQNRATSGIAYGRFGLVERIWTIAALIALN